MKSLERCSDAGSFVSSSDISDSDDGLEETNPVKERGEDKSKVPAIAKQENIYVFRWRIMVVVMMIVTAALVLTSTFLFLQREETGKFESAFLQSASTIAGASQFYTRNTLESLRNLGDALTSEAITSNLGTTGSQNQSTGTGGSGAGSSPLPLYTSPTFEIQAAHARFNSFTEIMVYAPRIATGAERDAWEEYSPKHYAEWMRNSKELVKETQPWFERDRMNTMMTGEAGAGGTIGAGEGYMGGNDNLWLGGEGGDNTFVVVADGDEQGHVRRRRRRRRRRRLEADDDMFMADDGFGPNAGLAEAGSPDGSVAGAQSESDEPVEPPLVPVDDGQGLDFVDRIYRFKSTGSEQDRRFNDQGDAFQRFKGRSRVASVAAASSDEEVYVPIWEISPPPQNATVLNFDLMKHKVFRNAMNGVVNSGGHPGFSDFLCLDFLFDQIMTPEEHWKYHAGFNSDPTNANAAHEASNHPHSLAVGVVRRDFQQDSPIVGHVISVIPWDLYMTNLLPVGENGVYAVVENKCGTNVTYVVNGKTATFLGVGDLHDRQFDYLKVSKSLSDDVSFPIAAGDGICVYDIHLYPSTVYKSLHYDKTQAAMFTAILAAVFVATGLVFFIFVRYVQRRQDKVMRTAIKTDAIVSSMFPEQVRDRLFGNDDEDGDDDNERADTTSQRSLSKHGKLKEFMEAGKRLEDEDDDDCDSCFQPAYKTKPIADLFPEATILFADLVGFTSWSSAREPTQVFILLETIYHMYDSFARKRRIFKVETIGDCYVAVTGLPDPRKDHAIAMCRFANDCCSRLADLLRSLEVTLGPDTGDLSMRFGLHSGPVTAGVLRGDKGRFQLFGDTMNTAARMEHTGVRGKIQLSKETATILENSGKSHWIVPRADLVEAKGKGTLQTYWLEMKGSSSGTDSTTRTMSETSGEYFNEQDINLTLMGLADAPPNPDGVKGQTSETAAAALDGKTMRLVDWNVETLLGMLRQVVAHRRAIGTKVSVVDEDKILNEIHAQLRRKSPSNDVGTTVVDEVQECIHLPTDKTSPPQQQESKPKDIKLGPNVENELRDFVMAIAAAYRNNPFHNFEHASHVAMSVSKLISRIAETEEEETNHRSSDEVVSALSHPLTQFSCVFSALLHDVDHSGVTNAQLIKEKADVAEIYKGTAIAEQNSVDVGWELLLDDRYKNLRQTIYANEAEFKRFRLLVVNSVMATDIFDGDLKKIRNERWNKAFIAGSEQKNLVDRKATIVIEHLMQASDVSHTMQHWHIYRKWNERLFREQSFAYETGRGGDRDPVEYWYKGEIDFFDQTILPLAKKLKECGVFGGSSFEYLNYAEHNREEWVAKGKKIVEEMKEKMQAEVKAGRCRPSVHNREVWADMKQTLEAEIKAADSALLCNARAAASVRHDAIKAEEEEEQGKASVGTTSTASIASSSDAPTRQQHVECEEESLSDESDSMAC